MDNIYITSGFAHPELAKNIAASLSVELGVIEKKIHPDGEIYSRFSDSVRGKNVFIIQPHIPTDTTSINDAIMQQALLIDAARSSSASQITAVCPYLGYMRQDRKTRGREPIGTRVLIDFLATSGVDRIVAIDIHAPQAQAIFRGPFDHLTMQRSIEESIQSEIAHYDKSECVVIAPDAGAAKLAQSHSRHMDLDILHLAKQRNRSDPQKIQRDENIPEANGKVCIVFDDMIDTAGTLVSAAEALKNSGAKAVYVGATHGIFSGTALERLLDSPVDRVVVSDSFSQNRAKTFLGDKLQIVSCAPVVSEAIRQIATNGSVSAMFDDENHM
jgi:ribose-phosphate pyrophosphokinase